MSRPEDVATVSFESWVEAPRWAGFKPEIEKAIIAFRLERVYVREDKRWLRTTIYFKVSGRVQAVDAFKRGVNRMVADYNGPLP